MDELTLEEMGRDSRRHCHRRLFMSKTRVASRNFSSRFEEKGQRNYSREFFDSDNLWRHMHPRWSNG
jgi:hypothetical protein